ncbi:unnamed protein product [Adineta ricciae]|uniref:Uncharacterized protein n=1 Tax=Adineta ricciae TaxID=249248 RepID=A0A814TS47_ADIRI|nr:unnamed protein product [Adineta ricciae]
MLPHKIALPRWSRLTQNGLCSQLNTQLNELSNAVDYLIALNWYDDEHLSLLMIATKNGHDDLVRILLSYYNSVEQVELKGRIKRPDGEYIDGGTALYAACSHGHFTVAKTLIEIGHANPLQDTYEYPYCPLLIFATTMDRLDIVRFLVENGYSDVNETKSTDKDQCTALIWAAFRGYTSIVKYLIENGADINYSCSGADLTALTPMSCACLAAHVEAVQLLYEAGADIMIVNNVGATPLDNAIQRNSHPMISFLLEKSINTIEDVELAICSRSYRSFSDESSDKVVSLLKLVLRQRDLLQKPKICSPPKSIYNYEQECQTIEELSKIEGNRDRIYVETLLIRERIFQSRNSIELTKCLNDYANMLNAHKELGKCIDIGIHLFYFRQQNHFETALHGFVFVFCQILDRDEVIPVQGFLQVCQLVFEPSQIDCPTSIFNAVFLVVIATKILDQQENTKEEKKQICDWIEVLCQHKMITEHGLTLLHICAMKETNRNVNNRLQEHRRHLQFPNIAAFRLLLYCGRQYLCYDAVDFSNRNTALHCLCRDSNDKEFIKLLLDYGFHVDCVNKDGYLPIDYVKNDEIEVLLMSKTNPSHLKCLCAHMIAQHRFNIECLGPPSSRLNQFVLLHGGLHANATCGTANDKTEL